MYRDDKISIKNSEHFFRIQVLNEHDLLLWHVAVFFSVLITRAKYLLHFWNIFQTENENCLALLRRPPTLHFPPLRQDIFKVHQTVVGMQIVILLWNWAELMLWSMKKFTFPHKFVLISHKINFFLSICLYIQIEASFKPERVKTWLKVEKIYFLEKASKSHCQIWQICFSFYIVRIMFKLSTGFSY